MSRAKKPLHDRIVEAEARSASALGNYNEATEGKKRVLGRPAGKWLQVSQFWLDRANKLRGWS